MNNVYIEGTRDCYSPQGETMTIGELKKILSEYDDNQKVYLRHDNGYTYGTISEDDFMECPSEDKGYDDEEDDEDE